MKGIMGKEVSGGFFLFACFEKGRQRQRMELI